MSWWRGTASEWAVSWRGCVCEHESEQLQQPTSPPPSWMQEEPVSQSTVNMLVNTPRLQEPAVYFLLHALESTGKAVSGFVQALATGATVAATAARAMPSVLIASAVPIAAQLVNDAVQTFAQCDCDGDIVRNAARDTCERAIPNAQIANIRDKCCQYLVDTANQTGPRMAAKIQHERDLVLLLQEDASLHAEEKNLTKELLSRLRTVRERVLGWKPSRSPRASTNPLVTSPRLSPDLLFLSSIIIIISSLRFFYHFLFYFPLSHKGRIASQRRCLLQATARGHSLNGSQGRTWALPVRSQRALTRLQDGLPLFPSVLRGPTSGRWGHSRQRSETGSPCGRACP